MKRYFLIMAASTFFYGCAASVPPKAMVIATSRSRAKILRSDLLSRKPELKKSEVKVVRVKEKATAEVLKNFDWAIMHGIKVINMDADSEDLDDHDPAIKSKSQALTAAGIELGGMAFTGK